jgi:hypothetical protein
MIIFVACGDLSTKSWLYSNATKDEHNMNCCNRKQKVVEFNLKQQNICHA